MILLIVLFGILSGTAGSIYVFVGGSGLGMVALAYMVFGAGGVVLAGLVVGLARSVRDARETPEDETFEAIAVQTLTRVTSPVTPSQARGTSASPSTRSGLVGGGMTTPGNTSKPNRS